MSFIAHMFYGVVPISLHLVEVLLFQRLESTLKIRMLPKSNFRVRQPPTDQEFLDGTRHVIYPWNQSKI
jgi:hypothetical protein